jgi:hypothetical protein
MDDLMEDDLGVQLKLRRKINGILADARRLVKLFCSSTVRNPILQKHVVEKFSKELKLVLDCETRWNSIVPMLERLQKLESCIKKALDDLGMTSKFDSLFTQLEEILKVCIQSNT